MFEIPSDVSFVDDLDVALDPSTHQDPSLPLPIAGNFGVRIRKMDLKKKFESDEYVLVDGKYPVIRISELEIVEPEDMEGRLVYLPFQEFPTKPFEEKEFGGRSLGITSYITKMVRSVDTSLGYRGLEEGLRLLEELVNSGRVFYVALDWLAEDTKWIGEQMKALRAAQEAGHLSDEDFRKEANKVRYEDGRREGIRNFIVNGVLEPVFVSPSGAEIEPRTIIKRRGGFIPANQIGKGPHKLGLRKELIAGGGK